MFMFWDFLMFYSIFLSPQVKRGKIIVNMIVTYKHGYMPCCLEASQNKEIRKYKVTLFP